MENKKEIQEADKYGQITFHKEAKLLVDIIGQDAIIYFMSKKNPKFYKSNKRKLERMNNGEMPDNVFTSLQQCCKDFFKEYKISPLVMTSLNLNPESFIRDFSLYAESNIILGKSKKEIALFVLHEQAFYCIEENLSGTLINDPFKTSEKKVLEFLRDSYDAIFKNKDVFNKDFYKEITKQHGDSYKKNIDNWRIEDVNNPNYVYNPNWRTLVPVLDYLKREHISLVHRLIGLYLRKNAQKALLDILDISEDELKEIIEEIANMIEYKKRPEKIPTNLNYDDIWFNGQRYRIVKCLEFQNNYENSIDVKKSNDFTKYLERNYSRSPEEKFLYFWLQTRAKIFEKHSDLIEVQEEILEGYKNAFAELLIDIKQSPFKRQFFIEIMLINDFFYPRRVKAIKDYYEHARTTLGIFNANMSWEKMLNILKEFRNTDIRKALVNIHSKHCPIKISP
jgi:hypothetical protein